MNTNETKKATMTAVNIKKNIVKHSNKKAGEERNTKNKQRAAVRKEKRKQTIKNRGRSVR